MISNVGCLIKVYFIDTGNMHCVPQGYAIHVPNIINLGNIPCLWAMFKTLI